MFANARQGQPNDQSHSIAVAVGATLFCWFCDCVETVLDGKTSNYFGSNGTSSRACARPRAGSCETSIKNYEQTYEQIGIIVNRISSFNMNKDGQT
eukprot:809865-Amphidinium_carterae.1